MQKHADIIMLAKELGTLLLEKNLLLTTAESCTGGGIAYAITEIPGSSQWFDCGFVTYSNAAKETMLQVPAMTIKTHGAVSAATAQAMAEGALRNSRANISVAVTGIAGPDGGSADKAVGTVWFAWAGKGFAARTKQQIFSGDREIIRLQAIAFALEGTIKNAESR